MLRDLLEDAAVAAAKAWSHPAVEPRHVLYVTARHFRDRPEVQPLLAPTKHALEPRGSFDQLPDITVAAMALLDSFAIEKDALAGLLAALTPDPKAHQEQPELPVDTVEVPIPELQPEAAPEPPKTGPRESTAAVLAELDALIGLESVKRQVKRVIAVVQANAERSKAGLAPVNPGLHLVFSGPPGTGKTTVARLVARLYASIGALPGAKFVEASRSDLVAGYVGQTAMKTQELINRTRPGVLFIDEAYALTPRHESDFGAEAVATLVKAMEDYRNDLAVIVAGYGDEMSDFIASNPGLRSRFKTYITFPNYTAEELTRIFEGFARESGIRLEEGASAKAEAIFQSNAGKLHLGNARFARSLFEDAYARMSLRAIADGLMHVDELTAIQAEDVVWEEGTIQRETRRVGFNDG